MRLPLLARSLPTKGENCVDRLLPPDRSVTSDGDVGNEPNKEEEQRDRQIGVNREDVPQRRPIWISGNSAAVRTAKTVIASAPRLIAFRHFARKR